MGDKIVDMQDKIRKSQEKKEILLVYYRLLTSKGNTLLTAVKQSSRLLGFSEIDNPRGDEFEDLRFDFKNISGYKYAVVEVHGTENSTILNKLRQCNQYVEDYYEITDDKVKGIFVVNQERLSPYPEEREKRLFFEPRQVQYCIRQNICIILTPVLFDLVNCFLRGNKRTRRSLENKIVQCKGVLNGI